MNLDLPHEETAALTQALHDIVENDRYPVLAAHPHAEGHSRQAQTGAGTQAPAAAESVCATASDGRQKEAVTLGYRRY
jgi:hypothetical protein